MDHDEAKRIGAVERYVLDELSVRERGDFEEHFFGCPECAAELRVTAEFVDGARRELKTDAAQDDDVAGGTGPPWAFGSGRRGLAGVLAGCAVVALVCVFAYQNIVLLPRLNARVVQLERPTTLAKVFLVGGNTRGSNVPAATAVPRAEPLLLSVDIPTADRYATYSCELVGSSSGTALWRLPITAQQAQDTVPIVVPAGSLPAGHYTLIVKGYMKGADGAPAELAHYPFTVSTSN